MRLSGYGLRVWLAATVAAAVVVSVLGWLGWWWVMAAVCIAWLGVISFFRDPARPAPEDLSAGSMLSPADGRITAVEQVPEHAATGGPAVVIRIFLSVLDVHVNRAPADGRVLAVEHRPGRHHDARTRSSAALNESTLITIALDSGESIGVRQIAGKVARRIVCTLSPGDCLRRGERFGMILFGSGTELILPRPADVAVRVRVGQKVFGGRTELATLGASRSTRNGPAPRQTARPHRSPHS